MFNVLALETTRACTNRCKYCYGSGRSTFGNMSDEVIQKSLDYMQQQSCKEYHISLLGGEPTLRLKYILPIIQRQKDNFEKQITISLNTNGLLFDENMCQLLKPFEPHLAISLDGPKEIHDLNRIDVRGNGTYDRLLNNIPLILDYFPTAFCQSTFTPDTIFALSDSYFLAKELGFKEWYWAPDLYESKWEQKHFDILQEQLNLIAKDYFNQNEIKYKGFENIDLRNGGNSRFKSNSHCLLVHYDGLAKISRLNATVIDAKEDSFWFIGNILNGIDKNKIDQWKNRYQCNADQLYYSYNSSNVCEKCPAKDICFNTKNPYLYKIKCEQPRMQCEQKKAITQAILSFNNQ